MWIYKGICSSWTCAWTSEMETTQYGGFDGCKGRVTVESK